MDEIDRLLPYYERELAYLQRDLLRFERDYPEMAARLSVSGGQTHDPHVDRLLQSAAWLNSRASRRVEDRCPEFTEALIETMFPAYLRPIPSCSIAQFDSNGILDGQTETVLMPRGTALEHSPSQCRFRTAWDVALAPLSITHAQFVAPSALRPLGAGPLPGNTAGIISIDIASARSALASESVCMPRTLRAYLHADSLLAAALIDTILLRPQTAFVEADGDGRWRAVGCSPIRAAGFADTEAIVDEPRHARQSALRLLIEYAAFPHKFRFLDFDLAALARAAGPCGRLTLHLPVTASAASASAMQRLEELNADHLRLFCTPVVNLFQVEAKPVGIVTDMPCYPIAVPSPDGVPAAVHSIDSVRILHGDGAAGPGLEIPPRRSRQHGSSADMFWLWERDTCHAREATGCDAAIRLVDRHERSISPGTAILGITLTCSNGNLPSTIDLGTPQAGLRSETLNLGKPVEMLVPPSKSTRPPKDDHALWQLVSALSPNDVALSPSGLAALRDLLLQLAESGPPGAARYIGGVTGLDAEPITRMMHIAPAPMPTLVLGIEAVLTIDEAAFAGHALYTFAQLMEQYFLRYATNACFELVVESHRGGEIFRGQTLFGAL